MKKYIMLILVTVLVIAGIEWRFKESEKKTDDFVYRFTFVCPATWKLASEGIKSADRDIRTNTKCVGFLNLDESRQIKAIQEAVYANVNGIITVGNAETAEFQKAIEGAEKKGIPVILIDSDIPASGRLGYVGPDNEKAGEYAGEKMIAAAEGEAKIGIVVSNLHNPGQLQRVSGFRKAMMEVDGMEVCDVVESSSNKIMLRRNIEQMLEEYPEINAICCMDEIASDKLGEVLEAMKKRNKAFKVVSFGESEEVLSYVEKGIYYSTIALNSWEQGYQAVSYLKDYLQGRATEEVKYIECQSISESSELKRQQTSEEEDIIKWDIY